MGRVAVVTGAASGVGLAICHHLADAGDPVALFDLNAELAEQGAEALRQKGAQALAFGVDVTDRPAVEAALAEVRTAFGPVEIMVTSAGMAAFEKFTDISLESWERLIRINLTGTFHCVQAVIPEMVDGGWGRIVMISSSSAQQGAAKMAHYAASKGGVIALTRSLAKEYALNGITVNTIPPSSIDTPMSRLAEAEGNLPSMEFLAKRIPVGRMGVPDDIAAACAFLCSEGAGFITGQVIGVNGGGVIG
jgi:2-hydroxycyclohexanecarboxyl-CoA dehydrogenase